MGQRPLSEIENGHFGNTSGANSLDDLSQISGQDVIADLIRMFLSRSSRHVKIKTDHVQSILHASNKKGSSREWISAARSQLETFYGLSLRQFGSELVLLSSLEPSSNDLLDTLWNPSLSEENYRVDLKDNMYLMPKSQRGSTTVSTPDQVIGGFTMLIVAIIVLCENNVSEADLLRYLSEFGVSSNMSFKLPVLNKPAQNVLAELTKRDYVKKSPPGAEQAGAIVEYSLGERCKREFEPQAINDLICEICKDENKNEQIRESVKKCFPDSVFATQASAEV